MSVPAWQKREMQQQKMLDDLKDKMVEKHLEVSEVLNRDGDTFFFELLQAILEYLGEEHRNAYPQKPYYTDTGFAHNAARMFWSEMRQSLDAFSRSKTEMNEVVAMFLEKNLLTLILEHFHSLAQREKHDNPKLILRAESGMDEVLLDD